MSLKSLVSPLALAAALSISTGAFAQTMVGDQAVTDEDLPAVSEHCQMLADTGMTEDAAAEAAENDVAADDAAGNTGGQGDASADEATNDAAAGDTPASDGLATDPEIATPGDPMAGDGEIDMEAITLEECAEAGLV